MTLTEFLLARIAEDEAAIEALTDPSMPWHEAEPPTIDTPIVRVMRWSITPARVLAECEAKRRIVELVDWLDNYGGTVAPILSDRPSRLTLRLLALPYADHPDYDETWRP